MNVEVLPPVTRLSDRVLRILGQENSHYKARTNTYLIGRRPPWILVDTGEGKEDYIPLLRQALRSEAPGATGGRLISDIVITHRHGDHHSGLPSVLSMLRRLWDPDQPYAPPRLHKYPLEDPTKTFIRKSTSLPDNSLEKTIAWLTENPDLYHQAEKGEQGPYFHDLVDGQVIQAADNGTTLKIIHTPGHTSDSVSLWSEEDYALFTGDGILGHGTAVFEDLSVYLDSLHRLQELLGSKDGDRSIHIHPGHGQVVEDGRAKLEEYIKHRLEREKEIIAVLETPRPASADRDGWTIEQVVAVVYASYPQSIWQAAGYSVAMHLLKLENEGRAERDKKSEGMEMKTDIWKWVSEAEVVSKV
ncbi:hypothetical protein M407DRAFT_22616 [Tulasnella calospora MUT 4182]|uniref:Metallo-beta-lactamase domain-containing protein n=1 Tax=Tulasnella calospora MUT 4182 TaxID=1051891 RepID=A0A0C3QC00_9AGAM|nr:hypothetical protein M407DRAFT_22616 [Tulasnella calospora MUT 4182]